MNAELFEKTRELGDLLLNTPEYQAVQLSQGNLEEDRHAQSLLQQYNDLQATLTEMMQAEVPDRAAVSAMSTTMRSIQEELQTIPSMVAANEAQGTFATLINQVNQVLRFVITGEAGDGASCSGNCAGCSSCK